MDERELADTLVKLAHEYPTSMVNEQLRDIPRIAFNIRLVLGSAGPVPRNELSICDIGGGIGLFSLGCATLGFKRVLLIDDFNDPVNQKVGDSIFSLHRKYGVSIVSRDVISTRICDSCRGFDVVTTFDSMEHWHHSPKKLFKEVMSGLKPGGTFILSVPNCLNLKRRATVLLGMGKWSSMKDWYELELFRGHVREPDVDDLKYIARDMGLCRVRIVGRNWMGHYSTKSYIRVATRLVDLPLRLKPSFCSDLYLVGEKPISPKTTFD